MGRKSGASLPTSGNRVSTPSEEPSLRVAKQFRDDEIHVDLLDDDGTAIPTVSPFLRHLRARGCSPNTLLAYAHDLQRLYRFLRSAGLGLGDFTPARALDFLAYLRDLSCRGPTGTARHLAPTTVNRNLAAVSSFYEYLIVTEAFDGRENPIQSYHSCRRRYPDLDLWLTAPLAERVGVSGDRTIANCSALARPYRYYLAYRGRLRFDWDWILGVGEHRQPGELLPDIVNEVIRGLGRDAARLGYSHQTVESRLPRLVKRFYLQNPYAIEKNLPR